MSHSVLLFLRFTPAGSASLIIYADCKTTKGKGFIFKFIFNLV